MTLFTGLAALSIRHNGHSGILWARAHKILRGPQNILSFKIARESLDYKYSPNTAWAMLTLKIII